MQGVTRNPLADPGILGVDAGAALLVVARDLPARRHEPARLRVVRVRRRGGRLGRRLRDRLARARAARRRSSSRSPARRSPSFLALDHDRDPARSTSTRSTRSASGSSGRWPAAPASDRGADRAVHRSSAPCSRSRCGPAAQRARARRRRRPRRSASASGARARPRGARRSSLLCGAATAAAGPIALRRPRRSRTSRAAITGPDYRWILPYSMVLAPILLLGADIVGRVVDPRRPSCRSASSRPSIGAPFFVSLVRRRDLARAVTGAAVASAGRRRPRGGRRPARRDGRAALARGRRRRSRSPRCLLLCVLGQRRRLPDAAAPTSCRRSSASAAPRPTIVVQTLRLPRALGGAARRRRVRALRRDLPGARAQPAREPGHHRHHRRAPGGAAVLAIIVARRVERRDRRWRARRRARDGARDLRARLPPRAVASYRLVLVGIGSARCSASVTSYLLTRAELSRAPPRDRLADRQPERGRAGSEVRDRRHRARRARARRCSLLLRRLRALQLGDDTGARARRAGRAAARRG